MDIVYVFEVSCAYLFDYYKKIDGQEVMRKVKMKKAAEIKMPIMLCKDVTQ